MRSGTACFVWGLVWCILLGDVSNALSFRVGNIHNRVTQAQERQTAATAASVSTTLLRPEARVIDIVKKCRATRPTSDTGESSTDEKTQIPQRPDMKAFAAGYKTVFEEMPCCQCSSLTSIPSDLVGTYYRVGPAMFSAGSIEPPKNSAVRPKVPPAPDGADGGNRMVRHPHEGDGAILAVTFGGLVDDNDDDEKETTDVNNQQTDARTVTARFRFVRTAGLTNERKIGAKLYTGMDSTRNDGPMLALGQGNDFPIPFFRHHLQQGLNKKRKNTSNTRPVYWSKKLLTLSEGSLPYKLDSLALSTEGRSQLGGILKESSPFGAKAAFDSNRDNMLFYSNAQQTPSTSKLTIFEFNSKFRLIGNRNLNKDRIELSLPGFAIISDFAVTYNYAIFVQPPTSVNSMQFILSKDPSKTVTLDQNASASLHLVRRLSSAQQQPEHQIINIPNDGMSDADLQFCNAYETLLDSDNSKNIIIMDVIRSDGTKKGNWGSPKLSWPWATTLEEYAASASKKSLWRYTIDPSNGSVTKQCLCDGHASFGVINPAFSAQKHQFIYMLVGGMGTDVAPPQGIAKINCLTGESLVWMPMPHEFCGEPMYAPRTPSNEEPTKEGVKAEDDGYILTLLFNGQTETSELIVLSAANIESGPICRIPIGMAVPHGYHGCFTPEGNWSWKEIDRRAKLADKMEARGNMWNEVKSDFSGLGLRLDDFEEYFGDLL